MNHLSTLLTVRSLNLVKLGSGVVYQLHRTSLNALAVRAAATTLWSQIKPLNPHYLVAPGLGAAPIAAAIAQVALADGVELETLAVRDPAKSRKNERLVEGYLPAIGEIVRCVFVDDTITSGTTYRAALQAVSQAGVAAQWVACAVLLDAWHPYGSRRISASGVPVFSALRRHDIGLTRDASDDPALRLPAPFNLAKPTWVRYGLVSKPEHTRKAVPVIWQDCLLLATDDCTLHCFDLATGDERWQLASSHPRSKGCGNDLVVQSDGSLLLGLYDGSVSRVDARTGTLLWSRRLAMAIHSAPTLYNGAVFVTTEDYRAGKPAGRCVALDYATGNMLWQLSCGGLCPTQTAVSCGRVAWASNDGQAHMAGIDGTQHRQWPLPSMARGRPAFVKLPNCQHGLVYACEAGQVICINAESGALAWQVHINSGSNHCTPQVIGNRIFLTDASMHLVELCAASGQLLAANRLRGQVPWRPSPLRYNQREALLCMTNEGHASVSYLNGRDPLTKGWQVKVAGKSAWPGNTPAAIGSGHMARLCADGRLAVFPLTEGYSA